MKVAWFIGEANYKFNLYCLMERDKAEEVIIEYLPLIYSVSLKIVKNKDEAEDVAQEACIKIYQALPGFKGLSSLKTWIYRLTVNASIDYLRKKKRISELSLDELEEKGFNPQADKKENIYENLEQEELKERVQEQVMKLPLEFRMPLLMKAVDGLSYEEIGEILQIPVGTVKSRIHRGRYVLKSLLFGEGTKKGG
ncbi:MAG: ECF RNA polymerase sigma factor SigH [candidate division WS2 bacterium]|nr:ECF RNA polymerase sigma factor SigH [Candidatus Psychracetigena formicireducens]MBT9137566.1 ECF RNA polymerase sigma factor SigH [Bacillota bacterium]MBT9150171.1 ECF RNA polymerase sigma factor SigH [Candidatus Psychracetigena formicireducens]